jgi:DNA-binding transcriptional regulator YiaG
VTTQERMDWPTELRSARDARGHSQREAAEHIRVPTPTYQTWEQGRREPRVVAYRRAAERYIRGT